MIWRRARRGCGVRSAFLLVLTGFALAAAATIGLIYTAVGGAQRNPVEVMPHIDQRSPEDRAFLENERATEVAAKNTIAMPPKDMPSPAPPRPIRTWPTGIDDRGPVPFPGEFYQVENSWRGLADGKYVEIYTLIDRREPSQGLLSVTDRYAVDDALIGQTWYKTPVKAGPIRISSANGALLTVVTTSNDAQFIFDVSARTWVSP